jgi:hypothetical protein
MPKDTEGVVNKSHFLVTNSITNLVDYAGQQMQRGLEFAWRQSRTRKRSKCQESGGGLGTDAALVFWDTDNCLMPLDCQ